MHKRRGVAPSAVVTARRPPPASCRRLEPAADRARQVERGAVAVADLPAVAEAADALVAGEPAALVVGRAGLAWLGAAAALRAPRLGPVLIVRRVQPSPRGDAFILHGRSAIACHSLEIYTVILLALSAKRTVPPTARPAAVARP